jgi:hypothetical protein
MTVTGNRKATIDLAEPTTEINELMMPPTRTRAGRYRDGLVLLSIILELISSLSASLLSLDSLYSPRLQYKERRTPRQQRHIQRHHGRVALLSRSLPFRAIRLLAIFVRFGQHHTMPVLSMDWRKNIVPKAGRSLRSIFLTNLCSSAEFSV